MNEIQIQIAAAFNALTSDEKNNTIKILTDSSRAVSKKKAELTGIASQVKVGDTVMITSSTFVAKKHWGKEFTVVKVAPAHFWLLNPEKTEKNLWPLHGEVQLVVKPQDEVQPQQLQLGVEDEEAAIMAQLEAESAAL
jgi:hypothetical protein